MNKRNLNILAVCIFLLIIVFSITKKNNFDKKFSDNIFTDEKGNSISKIDKYQENILNTVAEENIKNFQKFSKTFQKNSTDNLTDTLSKDIFTQYIKYNTSGELKDNDITEITNNILKTKVEIEKPVNINDIKTTVSNVENLKIYGTNIAIINNALLNSINKIDSKKSKILYIASAYKGASEVLKQVQTPDMLLENHILIINGYIKYYEGLQMLEYQNNDPAKALLGLSKVQSATEEINKGFEKIQKTIILNKVNYEANEPGSIWLSNTNNSTIKVE